MEIWEMLEELIEMVDSGEIEECDHPEPSLSDDGFCDYCFITNHKNVSLNQEIYEETTEKQQETIQSLWSRHCDGGDWDE